MRESSLRLNDKTVILYGPGHSITQSLAGFFTEQGSDVAFVGPEAHTMRKYADNLMDNRQIHSYFGRAIVVESSLEQERDFQDVISRVAETLGGLDILIDVYLSAHGDADPSPHQQMCSAALKFLEGRQRGRVLFLTSDLKTEGDSGKLSVSVDPALEKLVQTTALNTREKNITVNALSVGITENFLLSHFSKTSLKESMEKIKSHHPSFKLLEPMEVASVAGFLASPIASGVSGQILRVNKGLTISG